jgi:pimeloyl-ACP methyl ester carboxylesterase
VLDELGLERAVLVGNSMGAATALAFALASPARVSALAVITPGYGGRPHAAGFDDWDALADGLARGGVDGFLEAYRAQVDPRWWETVERFTRQRLERHRHPGAVAQALRTVPRSAAFDGLEELERIEAPALVVGSRDEADPGHPLKLAELHAERLPNAELVVEQPGESPLAWQGAKLSRTIRDWLKRL